MGQRYAAPWSGLLKSISILASVLLLGLPLIPLLARHALPLPIALAIAAGPVAIVFVSLLFTIRGYEIASGELLVHRLVWSTRIPLDGVREVDFDPAVLKGSIRTFGNGGLFSFSGWFYNKKLGRYRAYLTHHANVVVLRWDDHRIAVSPDRPEAFVETIRRRRR